MDPNPKHLPDENLSTTGPAATRHDRGRGDGPGSVSSNREIAVVQADYLALANDLEQAQALASTLELELSGKTNELARFKLIWERTQGDLTKFEQDIEALRRERHALANEAQRGRAFESKYQRVQAAYDELAGRIERLESELAREREAHIQTRTKLDQLTAVKPGSGGGGDAQLRKTLEALRAQIDRALECPAESSRTSPTPGKSDCIEINFSP